MKEPAKHYGKLMTSAKFKYHQQNCRIASTRATSFTFLKVKEQIL